MTDTKICVYCGNKKKKANFSFEHIWPDALGGDHLDDFWKTNDVCGSCNNISGMFVDGAFIKGFFVSRERSDDALSYLSPTSPTGIVPLNYLGIVQNLKPATGETIDFWVCTGANILHVRSEGERIWNTYAGGDPRSGSKRSCAGQVLVSLTSAEPYWIITALASVKKHFAKADRFVTNFELPDAATNFRRLDPSNPEHTDDLRIVREFEALRERGEKVHSQIAVAPDADGRFLAKVALGIGYNLFGADFLASSYGQELRKSFREADPQKRHQLRVRGSGYLGSIELSGLNDKLRWPGGWQLTLLQPSDKLGLLVTAPSGRGMAVQISDNINFLNRLGSRYKNGQTWVVVPSALRAVGPLPYQDYIAHMIGAAKLDVLQSLDDLRGDTSKLPATGISRAS